jgi:hypothetical protein
MKAFPAIRSQTVGDRQRPVNSHKTEKTATCVGAIIQSIRLV